MKKLLLALLFLLWAGSVHAATLLVIPSGGATTGNCQVTACTTARALAVVVAGDTITMANGTYTGASNLIDVSELHGTQAAPITIRATNDGQVFLDGGYSLNPIFVHGPKTGSSWIIIEGVNACCGLASGDALVYIASSSNITLRRVVAWNANTSAAGYVFVVGYSDTVLMEDVAGFGTGRIIMGSYKSNHVTYRRAFAHWMRGKDVDPSGGPMSPMQMDYDSLNDTWENVIGTSNWTGSGATQFNGGAIGIHSGTSWGDDKLFGSIFYTTAGQNVSAQGNMFITDWCQPGVHAGCTPYWTDPWGGTHTEHGPFTFKDVVFYSAQGKIPIETLNRGPCPGCSIIDTTTISSTSNSIGGPWPTQTNFHHYSTLSAMNSASANPFQASTGTGARVCKQYVGGTLTNTSLWPWPMDDRIKAALQTVYGASIANTILLGTAGTGYASNTVTSQMVQIFGAIPSQCMTGAPTITITTNGGVDFQVNGTSTVGLAGTSSLP